MRHACTRADGDIYSAVQYNAVLNYKSTIMKLRIIFHPIKKAFSIFFRTSRYLHTPFFFFSQFISKK